MVREQHWECISFLLDCESRAAPSLHSISERLRSCPKITSYLINLGCHACIAQQGKHAGWKRSIVLQPQPWHAPPAARWEAWHPTLPHIKKQGCYFRTILYRLYEIKSLKKFKRRFLTGCSREQVQGRMF